MGMHSFIVLDAMVIMKTFKESTLNNLTKYVNKLHLGHVTRI